MNTSAGELSTELQELYLENKHTLSDILYLEDESRFFQKLFNKVLTSRVSEEKFLEIEFVNLSLREFQNRREDLKIMVGSQQHSVEVILNDANTNIELSLVHQNAAIITELRALLSFDKLLKKELYSLVEDVIADQAVSVN